MLHVGLIGLGPEWEIRYRAAIVALHPRLRIAAVHLPVASRAEAIATEFHCDSAHSLTSMVERRSLHAVLILDTAWHGDVPFLLTSRKCKAVFLGQAVIPDLLARMPELLEHSAIVMPELPLRYMAVTQRLRELMATHVGRIRSIELHVEECCPAHVTSLIDWCRALLGQTTWRVALTAAGELQIQVHRRIPSEIVKIHLRFPSLVPHSHSTDPQPTTEFSGVVVCERGRVEFAGAKNLTWQRVIGSEAGETLAESLTSDRDSLQLMLDHFSRRVAGALVQVPTLEDLWIAHRLAEWARSQPVGSRTELSEAGTLS